MRWRAPPLEHQLGQGGAPAFDRFTTSPPRSATLRAPPAETDAPPAETDAPPPPKPPAVPARTEGAGISGGAAAEPGAVARRWTGGLAGMDDRARLALRRSRALVSTATVLRTQARAARLSSRPRGTYARIEGALDGSPVTGIVRAGGELDGDRVLVERALGAMPLGRGAQESGRTPLGAALLLARACDAVSAIELFGAGRRGADVPVAEMMHRYETARSSFSVTERGVGADHVVAFHGELDLASAPTAEQVLVGVARSAVVLDLSGLDFVDAAGVRAILHAKQRIESGGDRLVIRGAYGIVRRIFEVTGLSHLLGD